MQPDLLTAEELAVHLRVQADTVRRWAREGRIPSLRLSPKSVRFELTAVVEALRSGPGVPKEARRD